jgi:hypothetical protein
MTSSLIMSKIGDHSNKRDELRIPHLIWNLELSVVYNEKGIM